MHRMIIILFALQQVGCSAGTDTERQIARWEREGWSYVEAVGERVEQAEYVTNFSSDIPVGIGAFGTNRDGTKVEKSYPQKLRKYLVVTMKRPNDGGYFSLVFSRYQEIAPNKSVESTGASG